MFTTLTAVILFSVKKRRAPKVMTYKALFSACYRWANEPRAGNGPKISWQNWKSVPEAAQLLWQIFFSPTFHFFSFFVAAVWALLRHPEKKKRKAGQPSQISAKREMRMKVPCVCYSLHTSLAESYPFSEPRSSQCEGVESTTQLRCKATFCVVKHFRD